NGNHRRHRKMADWVVVVAFYTSVHLIERLRVATGDGRSNSHEDRLAVGGHRAVLAGCLWPDSGTWSARAAGWSVQAVQAAQRIPGKGRQVSAQSAQPATGSHCLGPGTLDDTLFSSQDSLRGGDPPGVAQRKLTTTTSAWSRRVLQL